MAELSAFLQQKRREKVTYPRCGRSTSFLKSKEVKWGPLAWPVTVAGGGGQVLLASRPSPGASPSLATVIHRSLGPGRCSLGLGHPGTRRQGCQEPSGAGGGPAASPGGGGKCYFCLLLSSGTGCPGRGGQRRPLQLSPAHREFLKDAHGCREDGRRGRGGWAGPPNPPPDGGGAG